MPEQTSVQMTDESFTADGMRLRSAQNTQANNDVTRVTREVNRAIRAAADQGLRRVTVPTRSFDVQSAVIATVMMNLHGRGFSTSFDSGKMTVSW